MVKLTKKQTEAVKAMKGNYLVVASGGSGKSSVFVSRIALLIKQHDVSPNSILGLTFTKDASKNVTKRLSKVIGSVKSKQVEMSTFHSFAYRFLRKEFPREFGKIDIAQSWLQNSIAYDIVSKKTHNNNDGLDLGIKAGQLLSFISYQKANLVRQGEGVITDYNKTPYVDGISNDDLQMAYDIYCERLTNQRVYTFDDLLLEAHYKLEENEALLQRVRTNYEYILVDEFQDTSRANMEILKLISNDNVFVVCDFRQSIYSFTSAEVDNVLNFKDEFANTTIIELEDNFRSTDNIIKISNDIIKASPDERYNQFKPASGARKVEGSEVSISLYNDQFIETQSIVDSVQERVDKEPEVKLSSFAVLARTNSELSMYESMFASKDIPVRISSGHSFYDRNEIVDILSYAKVAIDPTDNQSLMRIINKPNRYIKKSVMNDVAGKAYKNGNTIEEQLKRENLGYYGKNINKLIYQIEDIREQLEDLDAYGLLKFIYNSIGYDEFINTKSTDNNEIIMKKESIDYLFENAKGLPKIEYYLSKIDIIKNNNKKSKDIDAVNLTTVHSSKGLEYPIVYAVGMNNKNYPHDMDTDYEESRRLVYVAFSRARDELNVSIPVYDKDSEPCKSSPFLIDIQEDNILGGMREVLRGEKESTFKYKSIIDKELEEK